ncbi:MAG TPA: glycine--tRNA ligase, partial [Methanotrichaceae archaeon]|nr:glycine--tRNA ligase [Methanotrichaceae archaeon]
VLIDAAVLGPPQVWEASGHLGNFSDPLVDCTNCKNRFRLDKLDDPDTCPECGEKNSFTEAREFNLMFKTFIGPGGTQPGYIRPETAQGMFVNFQRLLRHYRDRLPFGAVQIGKSYRNEISPRQGVIRLREFSQAEAEIFINPRNKTHPRFIEVADLVMTLYSKEGQERGETEEMTVGEAVEKGIMAHETLAYYVARTYQFLIEAGLSYDRLRFRQHKDDEMAHYAVDCWDAEALLDRFGWIEIVGVADRTDYDLKSHMAQSQANLTVYLPFDEPRKQEKLVVKPDMKKLGPLFRKGAKAVADALCTLPLEDLKRDPIVVEVDGENVEIDPALVSFEMVDEEIRGEEIVPHVIEPSFGIDRILYSVLEHSYREEMVEGETRAVLALKNRVVPIQVAVLPLMDRVELIAPAEEIAQILRSLDLRVEYDSSGSIGRRYRRNDEVGTPYSVTVDYETLEEGTVTIRDRDSMSQIRVKKDEVAEKVTALLKGEMEFSEAGSPLQS